MANLSGKPVILFALTRENVGDIDNKNIVAYNSNNAGPEGKIFIDAELNLEDLSALIDNNEGILSHITDTDLHWSTADRREYRSMTTNLNSHIADMNIHVSVDDRNNWNAKETEAGAQMKANSVLTELNVHKLDVDVHTTRAEKERWNNTYTKNEVANMVANAQANTDWKEAVNTFSDLAIAYPEPEKGWICTVLYEEDGYTPLNTTYCYDGEAWVVAFINSMPLATSTTDGRMSKEYAAKLDNIEENANYYVHPDTINIRHVTDTQITRWDNKASKSVATIFEAGLMAALDKEKLDGIERNANYYVLPDELDPSIIAQDEYNRFVTDAQIDTWSNPVGVMASDIQDGAMSKEMYIKLDNIEENANYYVHPIKHSSTDIAEDTTHRFVTDSQISIWNNKEDPSVSQTRADYALQYAKDYTDEKISQLINSAPGLLDTFEEIADALGNDPNFAATMMTELNNRVKTEDFFTHTDDANIHLSTRDRTKFNSIEENANNYTHPDTHDATMINQDTTHRFVTDVQVEEWNAKASGTLATSTNDGQMSKEYAAKLDSITTTGSIKSDWNETDEDSGSFIMNKPTSLPANGGNAETLDGYSVSDLTGAGKPITFVFGASNSINMTDRVPDYYCDGTNDVSNITDALSRLGEVGGVLLFREGTYNITTALNISGVNVVIKGSGAGTVFQCGYSTSEPVITLHGQYDVISDLSIKAPSNATCPLVEMYNNFNTIERCNFSGGSMVTATGGSYNTIASCVLDKVRMTVNSSRSNNIRLMIKDNVINEVAGTVAGLHIESTNSMKVDRCMVNGNTITDCYTGILLSNDTSANGNTCNCIICNNAIMRANGDVTDYLYEQHTIRILNGSFNLVSCNMCRGRTPVDGGINNMMINNIAVDDGTGT